MAPADTSKLLPQRVSDETIIETISPNILTINHPFKVLGMMKIGARAIVCRLPSGSLAVFSPTPLTPVARKALADFGGVVKYLIAINIGHHLFLPQWKAEYPEAKILAPEGLYEKRAKQGDEKLQFDTIFTKGKIMPVDQEFDAAFDMEFVGSLANKDIVAFSKSERALIEGDVWFNLPALDQYKRSEDSATDGMPTKIAMAINSPRGDSLMNKIKWYLFCMGDQEGLRKSLSRIASWDFDKIVMCHGQVITSGGNAQFRSLFPTKYLKQM